MRAILIDDEPLALDYLEHQLLSIEGLRVIGKYTDPFEGRQAVEQSEAEIVFLDIHIPDMDGLELAEQLLENRPELHVVFVTAYDNFAVQAFELNACDYVLKPVRKDRLAKTIQRIRLQLQTASPHPNGSEQQWHLRLFHPFEITNDSGQPVTLHWRTAKAEQLFYYLLHHKNTAVGKSEIVELLWPGSDPRKSYPQMYTTIYHIRKALEPLNKRIMIRNTNEGYKLDLQDIVIDSDRFDQFLHADIALAEDTIEQYEQLIDLVRGEYMQEQDAVWVENDRQRYRLAWTRTTIKLMTWLYEREQWEQVMQYGERLCARYPLEEDAHLLLMKACAKLGLAASVHRQFRQLEMRMREEFDVSPDRAITEWYERFRASS